MISVQNWCNMFYPRFAWEWREFSVDHGKTILPSGQNHTKAITFESRQSSCDRWQTWTARAHFLSFVLQHALIDSLSLSSPTFLPPSLPYLHKAVVKVSK